MENDLMAVKVTAAIKKETVQRTDENGTDKLLPKFILDLSPFHTSVFITNLKSLGINHVYHHVYNFGTTGLFFAMGKEKIFLSRITAKL